MKKEPKDEQTPDLTDKDLETVAGGTIGGETNYSSNASSNQNSPLGRCYGKA